MMPWPLHCKIREESIPKKELHKIILYTDFSGQLSAVVINQSMSLSNVEPLQSNHSRVIYSGWESGLLTGCVHRVVTIWGGGGGGEEVKSDQLRLPQAP